MDVGQAITEAMQEQRRRDAWQVAEAGMTWRRPLRIADLPPAPNWCPEWLR